MTDERSDIIRAAQRGNGSAFRRLVEEHYRYVHRVAWRVVLDEETAKDVAQEVFVKVWQHLHTYDPRTLFTTWLYTITANTALDAVRSRNRMRRTFPRTASSTDEQAGPDPSASAEEREAVELARSGLSHLPPVQRLVIALRDFEDLSVQEVALATGLSASSVKANLSYARKRLRDHLMTTYDMSEDHR